MDKLLTVNDAADILQCHPQTVYRNEDLPRMEIPGIGVRFKSSDLEKYLFSFPLSKAFESIQDVDIKRNRMIFPPVCDTIKIGGTCEMPKGKNKSRFNFGYGAIYQRKTKEGNIRWYLDYRVGEKRVQKVVSLATSKEEAHFALQEEISKVFRREHGIQEDKQHVRFEQFSVLYLKNYSMVKKRGWERSDKVYLNANLIPFFREFELGHIDVELIEKFVAKRLADQVEKSTINRDMSCLKKMFTKAVEWEYLSANPALKIKQFPENDNSRSRILTVEEEKVLLTDCVDHLKSMVILSLHTGMRRGEILSLRWGQIDLQNKQIRVENTKSGKPRYIPLNSTVFDMLVRLKASSGKHAYVFTNLRTGKPFTTIKTAFNAACRRAKIDGLRFHDLRRTFATRILQRGADIETVKELLGHHSVLVTQRYTHSNVEVKRSAVELLSEKEDDSGKSDPVLLHAGDMSKKQQSENVVSLSYSVN